MSFLQRTFGRLLHYTVRVFSLPIQSEIGLFVALTVISSLAFVVDFILRLDYPNSDVIEPVDNSDFAPQVSANSASDSLLEINSVFIFSVFALICVLFVLGKVAHFLLFGKLNVTERNSVSHMIFRFAIFHLVILTGAINVSKLASVYTWLTWFGFLALLHTILLIASSRCTHLSASPSIRSVVWIRMIAATLVLFLGNWYLLKWGVDRCLLMADISVSENGSVWTANSDGRVSNVAFMMPTTLGMLKTTFFSENDLIYDLLDVVVFMLAESLLLSCSILYLAGCLFIHAYDRWRLAHGQNWSSQTIVSYYLELIYAILYHFIKTVHCLHLLLWSQIFSVSSLVVFLCMRSNFSILADRIRRHMAYRRLKRYIATNFELHLYNDLDSSSPHSTADLSGPEDEDKKFVSSTGDKKPEICAICWEDMFSWRCLPCHHGFHENCLRAWLQQNPSCPTCRRSLDIPSVLHQLPTQNVSVDHTAFGLLLRNLIRQTNSAIARRQPTQTTTERASAVNATTLNDDQTPSPSSSTGLVRTSVGLNVGVGIGGATVVTASAQATTHGAVGAQALASGSTQRVPTTVHSVSTTTTAERLHSTHSQPVMSPIGQLLINIKTCAYVCLFIVFYSHYTVLFIYDKFGNTLFFSQQIFSPAENRMPNRDAHVRRQSFHFDGSRYFSWLPSLHVELAEFTSQVFQESLLSSGYQSTHTASEVAVVPQINDADNAAVSESILDSPELMILPTHLRESARTITRLFPQVPLSLIVSDLMQVGDPDAVIANLRRSPEDTFSTQNVQSIANEPASGSTVNDEVSNSVTVADTGSRSTGTDIGNIVDVGSNLLEQRRASMLQRARQRFLARENR